MKKFCKLDRRELLDQVRLLAVEGRRLKYACTACGRASRKRGLLCKPLKIRRKNRPKQH